MNRPLKTVILYHPQILKVHQERPENSDEKFKLFWVNFGNLNDLLASKSFLGTD
jgi:hypothetical protein